MESNVKYKEREYWNSRYTEEDCYEWFKDYNFFKNIIRKYFQSTNKILILGCGNSRLSADMYADGFHHIVNVDYSEVCIQKMREKHLDCPGMLWETMDIRDLKFADGGFDVILEKGTLDALLVDEPDRWQLSETAFRTMEMILLQCSQLLKTGGKFLSITFEQPMFRKRIYARKCLKWSVNCHVIGDTGCIEYFVYCMTKGEQLSKTDMEFELSVSQHREVWLEETDLPIKPAEMQSCFEENDFTKIMVDS